MGMFDQNSNSEELTPEEALEAVCGEGKKYATAAELAKAKLHADNHIAVLEAELADLRKSGGNLTEVQELLKAIREGKLPQQQAPAPDQGTDKQAVDVDALLEEKLNARLSARTAQENQSKVIGHFKAQYGTKSGEMFAKLATELEMEQAELESMCSQRPGAVIKLAGQFLGGAQPHNSAPNLTGDGGQQGAGHLSGAVPTTKSELIKKAEAEKWPRSKKYEALHREMARATREGRLDAWNR